MGGQPGCSDRSARTPFLASTPAQLRLRRASPLPAMLVLLLASVALAQTPYPSECRRLARAALPRRAVAEAGHGPDSRARVRTMPGPVTCRCKSAPVPAWTRPANLLPVPRPFACGACLLRLRGCSVRAEALAYGRQRTLSAPCALAARGSDAPCLAAAGVGGIAYFSPLR